MNTDDALRQRFFSIACHLDEKQRRLLAAAEAQSLGQGGISRVARIIGISRPTITRGVKELGSVFFGACSYIGNGPNFMVKAIADASGARTPGFIGYILKYAIPILLPIYTLVWFLFLRT